MSEYDPTNNLGNHSDGGAGDVQINGTTGIVEQNGRVVGIVSPSALAAKQGIVSINLETGTISFTAVDGTISTVGRVNRGEGGSDGYVNEKVGMVANTAADPERVDPITGMHPNGWCYRRLCGPVDAWRLRGENPGLMRVGGAEGPG